MRDFRRIGRILTKVRQVWEIHPDLRLTQLIMNALKMNEDPYYVEDDKLEKALDEYIKLVCKNIEEQQ